jgi:hypothetical protein
MLCLEGSRNFDAQLLTPTTQNYPRQQAIRLREQGNRLIDIAGCLGGTATQSPIDGRTIRREEKRC